MSMTATQTVTAAHLPPSLELEAAATLPPHLLTRAPKLSRVQAGHLRHFHNLAAQLDGEWAHMGTQEPQQEFLDAYRYQIATMAYAAGVTHYHHLPAMRTLFRKLLDSLIRKMMRREVWAYWYLTSQGGKFLDPDIKELRKPWADPIRRENIMFSGHLLLMVSLYSMLFDDDKYDAEDALTFNWNPIFWGMGPEKFVYSRTSLQNAIVDEMERNKWMGVCCEPNSVFVVCNQFPLIAIRYNDVRNGTNLIAGILEKYQAAWKAKGMITENGLLVDWYRPKQDDMVPPRGVGFSAWAGAFMNAWNPEQVRSTYASQVHGFVTKVSPDRVNLNPLPIAYTIRKLAAAENLPPDAPETASRAREIAASMPPLPTPPFQQPTFGYVAQWLAELGETETLNGLLNHADHFMGPTWERGGFFYPRNDTALDSEGNWTHVDPFTGNGAIGYARLNVKNGQKEMWQKPWTSAQVRKAPWVDALDLADGVDVLRGSWVEEDQALVLTMRTWDGEQRSITPVINNLPHGTYQVFVDGETPFSSKVVDVTTSSLSLTLQVGGKELDVVVMRV